ncbi:MAG: hypothetical protein Q4G71_03475 [Pseudomonadota bacterium]|nr:hypothetical protein [Pseudomonadota bacterium]
MSTTIHRWSPHPQAHYAEQATSDEMARAIIDMPTTHWNVAWLTLPPVAEWQPLHIDMLEQSLECKIDTSKHICTVERLATLPAVHFATLSRIGKWLQRPRVMDLRKDWLEHWNTRARQARWGHPNILNMMIDEPANGVEAARIILSRWGFAKTFQDPPGT